MLGLVYIIDIQPHTLEFKQSFGWNSLAKYMKTFAAYSNAKGGYIAFGISNRPHKLVGLNSDALQIFDSIDPEKLTEALNDHFAPEIVWSNQIYDWNGKRYGIFYISESLEKPVVCTKNDSDDLKEGDIYYRYRGRTQRIKYPELRSILEHNREKEQQIWMRHISAIARIGVNDAGIFDLNTGKVTGSTGNSFLIDESLLSQLSFIREGEFSEVKGRPTLKLIGNIEVINRLPVPVSKTKIIKTKGIRLPDIILSFLDQKQILEPEEFIKQICYENSAFLPVYYFINIKKWDISETIKALDSIICRPGTKIRLIDRLKKKSTQRIVLLNHNTEVSKRKAEFIENIKAERLEPELNGKELEYCLQAIRSLTHEEVIQHKTFLLNILKFLFNRNYTSGSSILADNLRRAICWIDEALYADK